MSKVKKISFSVILTLVLLFSMSLTVLADSASTSFTYDGISVSCKLTVTWYPLGKDSGWASTRAAENTKSYYYGAYCNAYGKDGLLGGASDVSRSYALTSTINYAATEFRSVHNVQSNNNVPLSSRPLYLK